MVPVRVSVKSYLVPFLDAVGSELGTSDYTEIVNHLLRESKRQAPARAYNSGLSTQTSTQTDDDSLADSLLEWIPA